MGRRGATPRREEILREMRRICLAPANDAVRLAYLREEEAERIGELDLSALREFKRSGTGGVEIRLHDRLEALERLAALLEEGSGERNGSAFLRALEQEGGKDG